MTAKQSSARTRQDTAVAVIARTILGIETLETRKSDRLDFHEVAVWTLKEALEAAYESGAGGARQEALDVAASREPVRHDG